MYKILSWVRSLYWSRREDAELQKAADMFRVRNATARTYGISFIDPEEPIWLFPVKFNMLASAVIELYEKMEEGKHE